MITTAKKLSSAAPVDCAERWSMAEMMGHLPLDTLWNTLFQSSRKSNDICPPIRDNAAERNEIAALRAQLKEEKEKHAIDAAEVAAGIALLELLTSQLKQIAEDVERSVVKVCSGFMGISQQSQQAVDIASGSLQSGDDADGQCQLIDSVRGVLHSLLTNVKRSSEFSSELSQQITDLEHRLRDVEDSLDEVENIAEEAKVVALNGQIEAARLGSAGAAFGIVAHETKTLADNAGKTSVSIRIRVAELSKSMSGASAELKSRVATDTQLATSSEVEVIDMLNRLSTSHDTLTGSLSQMMGISQNLRGEISTAITGIQFQDRVNQCISHVVDAIDSVRDALQPVTAMADESHASQRTTEWKSMLARNYTMDSERLVHGDTSSQSDNSCSVELF